MVFCRSVALFHGTSFCTPSLQDHRHLHLGEYQTPREMVLPATHLGKGSRNWICNILPAWSVIPPPHWNSRWTHSHLRPCGSPCPVGQQWALGNWRVSHALLALGLSQALASALSPLTVLEYLLLKCVGCVSSGPHSTREETC